MLETLKNQAAVTNLPPLGSDDNYLWSNGQVNLAGAVEWDSHKLNCVHLPCVVADVPYRGRARYSDGNFWAVSF